MLAPVPIADSVIPQAEIDAVAALDNQIRALIRLRNDRCSPILRRLMNGAQVEPGTHTAEMEEKGTGACRLYRLVIDGHVMK